MTPVTPPADRQVLYKEAAAMRTEDGNGKLRPYRLDELLDLAKQCGSGRQQIYPGFRGPT